VTRALVTGGAGFIGSHLVDLLLASGNEVTVLDDLSTGRRANLEHHREADYRFVEGSATDPAAVTEAMAGCERVFHLAALADIVPSIVEPTAYFRANIDGTGVVVEAARRAGVEKLVYAASSSCYGIPEVYPTSEQAPIAPQYPYAFTKWIGEQIVRHWGKVYGLPYVSLRLFNVYGPRSRTSGTYGAVMGVFLAQKLAGKPLTIVGDGTQTRDFTYVTDVARAFAMAAESDLTAEVLNVGSGGTYSVNDLASLIGGDTIGIPHRPGEPAVTFADTTAVRDRLGWEPQVGFEEGVARVIGRIEDWRDAPVWEPASIAEATRDWFTYLGRSGSE
jgi:UDP-glucose 4-epimerase